MGLKKTSFLLFCLIIWCTLCAQEINYASFIIDTLTSPSMHGRGYINDGDKLAATFLAKEFERLGLKKWKGNYLQRFKLSVNTFQDNAFGFGIKNNPYQFSNGKNVLVGANSPSAGYGTYKVLWLDSLVISSPENWRIFLKNNFSDKVVVVDRKGVTDKEQLTYLNEAEQNPFRAKAIVVTRNTKLTWEVSQSVASFPSFELLIPDSIHAQWRKQTDSVYFYVNNHYRKKYVTQNIIGYIPGKQFPDSFIVFSAHYDHLGRMGKDVYFPGANDNASGTAMLLQLAKHYTQPEHQPAYSIVFMAFGAEEAGLVGSRYYVEHPLFPLSKIKFLVNMDIMGTGDEGITVVNATEHKHEFELLQQINKENNYLTQLKARGKTANSDHYFFEQAGVKTFFIYTLGGIKAYHDIYDRGETLPLTRFKECFLLLKNFVKELEKNK